MNTSLYPLDVVQQAAYLLLDECYLHLTPSAEPSRIDVALRPKQAQSDADWFHARGRFSTELLNQLVRRQVADHNGALRELIVNRAIYGALGDEKLNLAFRELERNEAERVGAVSPQIVAAEQEELDRLLAEIDAEFQIGVEQESPVTAKEQNEEPSQ